MKVDIKVSSETILVISATLQGLYNAKSFTRRERSTLSIALDVINKIDVKAVSIRSKMNLFESDKKIKVSLKFHEADMLELLLIQEVKNIEEIYIRLLHQKLIDQLNQKLV